MQPVLLRWPYECTSAVLKREVWSECENELEQTAKRLVWNVKFELINAGAV